MATSGPGAIHLLNGLYDAKLDHQPVLAIVGQQARAGLGGNFQQEVDLQTQLFKDVCPRIRGGVHGCHGTGAAPGRPRDADRADRAHRHLHHRSPIDVQKADAVGRAAPRPRDRALRARLPAGRSVPKDARISAPRPRSSTPGEKVAMLVGQGASARLRRGGPGRRAARVRAWPRRCWARRSCPTTLPWVTGSIGLLGTKPSWDMMMDCRHPADGRLLASPTRSFCPRRARPAGSRSTSTARCSGSAIRWSST